MAGPSVLGETKTPVLNPVYISKLNESQLLSWVSAYDLALVYMYCELMRNDAFFHKHIPFDY